MKMNRDCFSATPSGFDSLLNANLGAYAPSYGISPLRGSRYRDMISPLRGSRYRDMKPEGLAFYSTGRKPRDNERTTITTPKGWQREQLPRPS